MAAPFMTPKNSKLKAFIFDVDGTLSNTERDGHRIAFNQAFEEYGMDWHWSVETYGKLLAVTGGKERMKFYVDNFLNKDNLPEDIKEKIPELHAAKTRHYTKLLSTGAIPLRPGVERLIQEARQRGYRLAIATTTTPENVTALLTHTLGVDSINWFEVIAAGDVVPSKKPAPDIYQYVLDKMHLSADECIAFEDSENGIKSSIGANLKTIITINDYTENHNFTDACLVLDQMGEPEQPFSIIAGNTNSATYLNCDLIEILHQSSH
ncbi:Xylulose-1,5-bisphosphate phosphatase CbbY, converts this Rubisco inhibiting byproduct to xylulose-5P [hydrothermal vent metagenome]|uniref:Xylulose-1,5-bisphosphate phosphatase CbbY, converts this Rubisco inhibiting byproduct to xylulose-5P n=1 Tax=hydrothermal vent metagenome TaxID=652676 RepID=A0A3B0W4D4_9ZZZZ